MSVQSSYGFSTPKGVAGGLYDQSPYVVDTRLNESASGKLLFGMGVVQGSAPGTNVAIPETGAVASNFEGIVVNGFTQQYDLEGVLSIANNQSVGVLREGRIWARVADEVSPSYGDDVYLVISGDDAGLFTNAEAATAIKLNAKFIGSKGTGAVAPVALYA